VECRERFLFDFKGERGVYPEKKCTSVSAAPAWSRASRRRVVAAWRSPAIVPLARRNRGRIRMR
jgi:hypothetical protein